LSPYIHPGKADENKNKTFINFDESRVVKKWELFFLLVLSRYFQFVFKPAIVKCFMLALTGMKWQQLNWYW